MTYVRSAPGVPHGLQTVVASSATPVLAGPPREQGSGIVGTGVISTLGVLSWVSSTGADNVWPAVLTERGVAVSSASSTPIVYGPVIFSGAPFNVQGI